MREINSRDVLTVKRNREQTCDIPALLFHMCLHGFRKGGFNYDFTHKNSIGNPRLISLSCKNYVCIKQRTNKSTKKQESKILYKANQTNTLLLCLLEILTHMFRKKCGKTCESSACPYTHLILKPSCRVLSRCSIVSIGVISF